MGARICAGEAASSRILIFVSYVSQLFVPLLKAQLLPKLLGSFDSDYKDFCLLGCDSWYICVPTIQNKQLLPSFHDIPPNFGLSIRHQN